MQKTLFFTVAFYMSALLTGCASSTDGGSKLINFPGAYRIDIQQGNVITQDMVNQLRLGMTRNQVLYVMGSPLLKDSFDRNRWDYVYSLQPGNKKRHQENLILFFDNDKLIKIDGSVVTDKTDTSET
ncbi:Outer membrane protein assembly factor BamE [invertebrate metagenome]|uniref:Outer membrane protein assembly factor BamE n=1 Tax=invertebrate metagenome TaxID=1711999 RepID=A0A2H9T2V5_9ZZZZ